MKFTPPLPTPHRDADTEAVRRNVDRRFAELLALPSADMVVIPGVELPNGARVFVPHRLGRRPTAIAFGPVRTPSISDPLTVGVIRDYGDVGAGPAGTDPIDRAKVFVLQAGGYTSTVIVDLVVT